MVERFGDDLLDGVNMLVMLMQGTPMTYYGDEIGMVDGTQQFDSDPEKRQNYRTLMQVGGHSKITHTSNQHNHEPSAILH